MKKAGEKRDEEEGSKKDEEGRSDLSEEGSLKQAFPRLIHPSAELLGLVSTASSSEQKASRKHPFASLSGRSQRSEKRQGASHSSLPHSLLIQIKKAFRKLALTNHPDHGGDAETFRLITEAYEVLVSL